MACDVRPGISIASLSGPIDFLFFFCDPLKSLPQKFNVTTLQRIEGKTKQKVTETLHLDLLLIRCGPLSSPCPALRDNPHSRRGSFIVNWAYENNRNFLERSDPDRA